MVDILSEIKIARPIAMVAEYAANPDNAPTWYVNIKQVDWKTGKPLVLGSQMAFVAHFLGKKLEYTYEVVEWLPEKKFVMRTADGPFPMETTYEWTAVSPSETRMTLRNRGKPTGFSRIFAPFMKMAMRRANQKDLQMQKSILEK